ncbi:(3S,6E)-nerolidol synthase 1 [Helianthus annuus]|nr:(3S,6E)-nerolidol synthase 1 [Helianthus annuus]
MAAQNTLSAITSFTPKSIPQLLKPAHLQTTSVRKDRHISSLTTSDRLKWRSKPLKPNEFICKCINRSLLQCQPEDTVVKHAKLVEVVREMTTNGIDNVKFDHLLMVDALERLGLDYHYEDEINLILEQCYLQIIKKGFIEHRNLYEVSLSFRILRQRGFRVPSDVFELFMGKNGKFIENLKYDIRGLTELYEASHLSIEGEDVLEEAAKFSSHMLQNTLSSLDDKEARRVKYTLENPHRRNFTYLSLLNSPKEFDAPILKELAELECMIAQPIRKMEINEVLRWWKDLGLGQDLKLARNQPLKWYVGSMASLADPTLSQQRIDMTKTITLIYIIDDVFDIYGTLNELTLLTEAVNMWDISVVDQLPYYVKSSFKAVYDTTNEIASRVYEKHGFNPIKSLRKSWATLFDAFLVEAKWFASGHIPKSEEYLKNGLITIGVQVFLVHMFFLLGDGNTEEKANLIDNNHEIVSSVSNIFRISNDLQYEKDENQEGHDGSYFKYLLMEHEFNSTEIAHEYVKKIISDTWKCLNKECLSPNPFSEKFLKGCINLARLAPLMYGYNNKNSSDLIEKYIRSIL